MHPVRRVRDAVAVLGCLCAVAACAVAPPTGPTVMGLPPQGKSLAVFQQEDAQCRYYAAARIGNAQPGPAGAPAAIGSAAVGTAGGTAAGTNNAADSGYDLQTSYNIAYAQCMYSVGNAVQYLPPNGYDYYGYGSDAYSWYGYPWYGYPWYGWGGPAFFAGGFFAFDGHHHFDHDFHDHFHQGFHDGGGFHGGGGFHR